MSNGRFLSKSIANDDKLTDLSLLAYCLYLSVVPHLDKDGILDGRAKAIKGQCVPLRDEFTVDVIEQCIAEWVDVGLVDHYASGRHTAIWFHGFSKNQTGQAWYHKERDSRFDAPPGYERGPNGLIRIDIIHSGVTPELVQSNAGVVPELVPTNSDLSISTRSRSSTRATEAQAQAQKGLGEPAGAGAGAEDDPDDERSCDDEDDPEAEPERLPERAGAKAIPEKERQKSRNLLTDPDVGIEPEPAAWAAARWPFQEIRAHVMRYRRDRKAGKVQSPGVILSRLKNGWPAAVIEGDERSGVFIRHRTDDDDQIDARRRRQKYAPDELAHIIIH